MGACPRPVFETYQYWQRELERQPVEFLGRRSDDLLDSARGALATYLNVEVDEVVFLTNATIGLNTVARALALGPNDEVLTTDHEYGAIDNLWDYVCQTTGARLVRCPIPAPVESSDEIVDLLWSAVTAHTRVIAMSHITSPTAIIFPVDEICRRARDAGVITVIDGAHGPGQIPLDLTATGADFYVGNLHKWLCAPKGAGFLFAGDKGQRLIDPLIVSWGGVDPATPLASRLQWQGTQEIASFLSTPAAIEFQRAHNWAEVR